MNREVPFASVLALALLSIFMASATAREKMQEPLIILPPDDAPVEQLEAQPRMPIAVVPLSGSTLPATLSQNRHQRDGAADPAAAQVCVGTRMSPSECAGLAARVNLFMSERRTPVASGDAAPPDICGKRPQHATTCAAIVGQITTWLNTRQTAVGAAPPSALVVNPASDH